MDASVFDLFRIGIGPSSPHTVGPMKAARMFVERLRREGMLRRVARIKAELYGSLGSTGKGHGSDTAIVLGLAGHEPDTVDTTRVPAIVADARRHGRLTLHTGHQVGFDAARDITFLRSKTPARHADGVQFHALDAQGHELRAGTYYSLGGGFMQAEEPADDGRHTPLLREPPSGCPLPFHSAEDLLHTTGREGCTIAQVMRAHERCLRDNADIDRGLLHIWHVMQDCVRRGCMNEGVLPGDFRVRRRAPALHRRLLAAGPRTDDPLVVVDWVTLYALAVNEENAAGGRVVTAPTNGVAGIVPAVLHYYRHFVPGADDAGIVDFLLTAGAIGLLYGENASISDADLGSRGEIGVACSMAAAGLAAVLGGTPDQVENAAEIAMEHHLGLTCDPVGGPVQIACIERNAVASVKAISAARMALFGDGTHHVSLDQVIKTMRETGVDLTARHKQAARFGLVANTDAR